MRTVDEIKAQIAAMYPYPPCSMHSKLRFEQLRAELRAAYTDGIDIERLEAICAAEKEGLPVELPRKIGEPIFFTHYVHKCARCNLNHSHKCLANKGDTSKCPVSLVFVSESTFTLDDYDFIHNRLKQGRYFTHAEAEAALAAKEG